MVGHVGRFVSVAGPRNAWQLFRHSSLARRYARRWGILECLIALEKCGLNPEFLRPEGCHLTAHALDDEILGAVCGYLVEVGVLERTASGAFRAARPLYFRRLLRVMAPCYAYHQPVRALDRLARSDWVYGREVKRDDEFDAIAGADLTSRFSYAFSLCALRGARIGRIADLGCGTGAFLHALASNGIGQSLYGVDRSGDAIEQGRARGFESGGVSLHVGDLMEIQTSLPVEKIGTVDVFSLILVLHEFADGDVRKALAGIRNHSPDARILLVELDESLAMPRGVQRRTIFPELRLVHSLSNQRFRSASEWKRLFAACGYVVQLERTNRFARHLAIVFEPN